MRGSYILCNLITPQVQIPQIRVHNKKEAIFKHFNSFKFFFPHFTFSILIFSPCIFIIHFFFQAAIRPLTPLAYLGVGVGIHTFSLSRKPFSSTPTTIVFCIIYTPVRIYLLIIITLCQISLQKYPPYFQYIIVKAQNQRLRQIFIVLLS